MSVLIEAYSVVIKGDVLLEKWPGGWEAFEANVPNKTLCTDGSLVRVGFMVYQDAIEYCQTLRENNLTVVTNKKSGDYVLVGQLEGPVFQTEWLIFEQMEKADDSTKKIAICRHVGDTKSGLSAPIGWKYDGSFSDKPNFASNEEAEQRLEKIRRRDGVEVYYDKKTRKQVFVGRTNKSSKK